MHSSTGSRRIAQWLLAAACCAAVLLAASSALALDTTTRTAAEIRARWAELRPTYAGSTYAVAPSTAAPYSAGSLSAGFMADGLDAINYVRYLAGLPDDVVSDPTYTDKAQHGAVLLAAGTFSHTPPQPADMPAAFYNIGYSGTSQSNIGWGYPTLWEFNVGCADDSDSGNIDRLGHRRWLLYPALAKTGMGYAGSRSDTFVFDSSRASAVDYDSVKWPCAGLFPAEMFDASTAWSITMNPSRYSWTSGAAGHTVTLVRERDGKAWTFTSADTNTSGEYFNFETNGYGVANCFVFRPDPASVGSYQAGDVFDVTLSGGITNKSDGSPATIAYKTGFMSVAGSDPGPSVEQTGVVTPPPAPAPVACRLTAPRLVGTATHSKPVRLAGTLSPGHRARVSVQVHRLSHGRYRTYKAVATYSTSAGAWRIGTRLPRGYYRVRALTPASAEYLSAHSAWRSVRVK